MKKGLVNVTVEEILRIRINCYDVLITLLEYDQNLLDVGEKVGKDKGFCLCKIGFEWCDYF